jgi:hypothetical protein
MAGKRAETLLDTMRFIERFTLDRAWTDLTDQELFWEPLAGSWGVRRRSECRTPTPFGDGEWVVDFDFNIAGAAGEGETMEPLTTIGWLLWHVGSQPKRLTDLDFLGGPKTAATGWTSPYLSPHPVFTSADDAVATMRDGWRALRAALGRAADEELERSTNWWSYGESRPPTYGAQIVASTLNEVSHHGTQMCMLRDLYRWADGGRLAPRGERPPA